VENIEGVMGFLGNWWFWWVLGFGFRDGDGRFDDDSARVWEKKMVMGF
jgi:hypothetical protein